MKKLTQIVIIIMATLSIFSLSGCSQKEESIPNQYETMSVSDDFLINDECEDLTSDIKIYLGWIQHYYNHSDKINFKSFEYEGSNCVSSIENIESHKDNKISINEESLVKTKLVGYYLKIEYILSEKELLEVAGNAKSEDWFNELGTELDSIHQEMSNGYK